MKDYEAYINLIQHRLTSVIEEKADEIKQSYQQSYFLQQASLNVGFNNFEDYVIVGDGTCDNVSPLAEQYYCFKFLDLHSEAPLEVNNHDLLEQVIKFDVLEVNDANKQEIIELYDEVLSLSEDDFYVVLNIYLNLLITHNIEFDEKDFIDKVSSYECALGYCTETGNYDFEMSIYLNNILNLLKGDEHAKEFR